MDLYILYIYKQLDLVPKTLFIPDNKTPHNLKYLLVISDKT